MQEIIYTQENVENAVKRLSVKLANDIMKRNSCEIPNNTNTSQRASIIIINKSDKDAWDDAVMGNILNLIDSIDPEKNEPTESFGQKEITNNNNSNYESNTEVSHVIVIDSEKSPGNDNDDKLVENIDSLLNEESTTEAGDDIIPLQRTPSNLSRRSSIHRRRSTDSQETISKSFIIPERIVEELDTGTSNTTDTTNTTTKRKFSLMKKKRTNDNNNSIGKGFLRKIFNRNVVQSSSSINAINGKDQNNNNNNLAQPSPSPSKPSNHVDHGDDKVDSLSKRNRREIVYTAYAKKDNENTSNNNNKSVSYSNFYLAMPNGQWMVRTRTASRKILNTQHIDIKCI